MPKAAAQGQQEELLCKNLKVLHLSFHKGCINEFEAVAKELGLDLVTWFIPALPAEFFDGSSSGNALYNIGHDRAAAVWRLHHHSFENYDVIVTSDTAPLSRIFLQNQCRVPLVIWICNRFDYHDAASLDCDFPDEEYYDLFRKAASQENVTVIAYNEFEHFYAKTKGVDTGSLTITPCMPPVGSLEQSRIPNFVSKSNTFFLPPYHNEQYFMDLSSFLNNRDIENYCGAYNGPLDLKEFKGIIHLPYAWSNLAFFENLNQGMPYFLPDIAFLKQLIFSENYFFANMHLLITENLFQLSEWYSPEHADIITYFHSWDDLEYKIATLDYEKQRSRVKEYAKRHQADMLSKWREVFAKIRRSGKNDIEMP